MSAPVIDAPSVDDEATRRRPGSRRAEREPRPPRAPRPARGPVTGTAATISSASTMVALLVAWLVLHLLVLGQVSHARSQDLLFKEFRPQLAGATAPVDGTAPAGSPVALLSIPKIGLEQVVVEGTGPSDLFAGPGHQRNTVLPGQTGTSVVMGRSVTYGAPFADLAELRRGDLVKIATGQGELSLRVIGLRRKGDPLPQPRAAEAARLTLVTAGGAGRFGGIRPDETFYVDTEAPKGFVASGRYSRQIPASEKAMARATDSLPTLSLGLLLLTALTVGVILARRRWGWAVVWVVAAPVALALAWTTTDAALQLLPNLY